MITLTASAITKLKQIMTASGTTAQYVRFGVIGGGCSGYGYNIQLENEKGSMDKQFELDGLKLLVDGTSYMYLKGTEIDYSESLLEAGFKFNNPNSKSTCGCGKSFSA